MDRPDHNQEASSPDAGRTRPLARWLAAEHLAAAPWPVRRWEAAGFVERTDQVVIEEPFEIRLKGRSLAVIMRTPGCDLESDRELALGFLLSEGVIAKPEEIEAITRAISPEGLPLENTVEVRLADRLPGDVTASGEGIARFERRFLVASSCGLCGKDSLEEVRRRLPPLAGNDFKVRAGLLGQLPEKMRQAQPLFDRTGGLHAAGLFDQDGRMVLLREDIGRHNGVDRLLGRMALDGRYPLPGYMLLVSGRVSFEIVQKALAGRISLVAAVSAPSHLALELAQESRITVVGFLREGTFNCYTWPERVIA